MDFKQELVQRVKNTDVIFKNITDKQLQAGYDLYQTLKPFEHPEERLSKAELFCLSAYCNYLGEEKADEIDDDDPDLMSIEWG